MSKKANAIIIMTPSHARDDQLDEMHGLTHPCHFYFFLPEERSIILQPQGPLAIHQRLDILARRWTFQVGDIQNSWCSLQNGRDGKKKKKVPIALLQTPSQHTV